MPLTILPPTVPFSVLVALALVVLYELLNAEVAVPPLLAAVPACAAAMAAPELLLLLFAFWCCYPARRWRYRWRWRLRRFA
jgi:hypothetical protein